MDNVKVLIVDKQDIFKEGLRSILHRAASVKVVGTCCRGSEAIEKVSELQPDVVIIDTEIPDIPCTTVMKSIRDLLPTSRIIVLTHSEEHEQLLSTIKAGATAYLSKDISKKDLIKAVTLAAQGELIISPPLAGGLLMTLTTEDEQHTQKHDSQVDLSYREKQVFTLVTEGKTNKEIANALFISVSTVKAHLRKIMTKMQVHSRIEAIRTRLRRPDA